MAGWVPSTSRAARWHRSRRAWSIRPGKTRSGGLAPQPGGGARGRDSSSPRRSPSPARPRRPPPLPTPYRPRPRRAVRGAGSRRWRAPRPRARPREALARPRLTPARGIPAARRDGPGTQVRPAGRRRPAPPRRMSRRCAATSPGPSGTRARGRIRRGGVSRGAHRDPPGSRRPAARTLAWPRPPGRSRRSPPGSR